MIMNSRTIVIGISIITLLFLGLAFYQLLRVPVKEPAVTSPPPLQMRDYNNTSYILDGESVMLTNGVSVVQIVPGSSNAARISIFGEPVIGDFDRDGDEDAALYLVKEMGGSGTFYYAALAMREGETITGTNALFLGDRIAPQPTTIVDGRAVFNYAERGIDESFTTPPSYGKSLYVHYNRETHTIGEFVPDFEGEADPARMTLTMKEWFWIQSTDLEESIFPKKVGDFSLTFLDNGQVRIKTDCNAIGGHYEADVDSLRFSDLATTLMYCEGSMESVFNMMLGEVETYEFTGRGELLLHYGDSGIARFR
jgi:heat shock protein HslJ